MPVKHSREHTHSSAINIAHTSSQRANLNQHAAIASSTQSARGKRVYNFEQQITTIKQYMHLHVTSCAFDAIQYFDEACNAVPLQPAEATANLAFRAVARMQRAKAKYSPLSFAVLMDPGAELNLIKGSLIKGKGKFSALKLHSTVEANIDITNNGKTIGHVSEAAYLSFTLDTVEGVAPITYSEWFHVMDNLNEDLVLGALFCKEQCFTSFHARLQPWSSPAARAATKDPRLTAYNATERGADTWAEEFEQPAPHMKSSRDNHIDANDVLWELTLDPKAAAGKAGQAERKRERVTTTCEKVDAHATVHAATNALQPCKLAAGRRVRAKRNLTAAPETSRHENHMPTSHAPVQFNETQTKQIANLLSRRAIDEQKTLYKTLQQLAHRDVPLSMDEAENLRDTANLCASEAAKVFARTQQLLDAQANRSYAPAKHARYFMDCEEEGGNIAPAPPAATKFVNGQMVILQNLQTNHDLNGKPARVINYDAETQRYAISIATPRGFWWAKEAHLKALDPPRERDDFVACGIDHNSGQPTLDPLEKPVHRQYGKEYSAELTAKIAALLEQYKDVFGKDISKPCKFRPMSIALVPNAILPRNPRYWKNSPAQRAEVRKQLQSMIDMKVVRASSTAIVSNVLLVKRPGMPGKFRFTIDFRDLNTATEPVPWQMPEVQAQLGRLAGNCVFGCIDLSSYYHQIELDEGSKFLTGFITEDGVFEYNRVAMGLKGACAHAQSCLQTAIDKDPVLSKYGLRNYFDDLPLAAKSEDEFLEQLTAVLELGRTFNLKFNLEKSIFGVKSITHVGFIVNAEGVEVDPQRLDALRDIPVPKSMKGVQSVLGMWNYIRHFIKDFSTRALPLTNLVGAKSKAKSFLWTEACQHAFDDLKAATLDTKLLANINYNEPIYIRCDSSQFGAGAVLFQIGADGHEHPISYASRKYTMAERNYCTFQQEAAAVVWSLEKFSEFHQGHHVIVQSDHKNLSWIKKTAMPQLTRWRLRLQDFDFSLEYYEGFKNVCADGLSRKCVDDEGIEISIRDFIPEHAAAMSIMQGATPTRALNEYKTRTSTAPNAAALIWAGKQSPAQADADEPSHGAVACEGVSFAARCRALALLSHSCKLEIALFIRSAVACI